LRVAVLGDDPLARAGLAAMLAPEPALVVVAQLSPMEWSHAPAARAQVVLWDADPRSGTSNDMVDLEAWGLPVLALVRDPARAAEALAAGARGVLGRDADAARLSASLLAIARGLVVMDPDIAAALLPSSTPDAGAVAEPLTPRELEVLQLLARGLANKEIASSLGISEHTAKFHVNAILEKLDAKGRTEAVVRAARRGLIVL
jgi:DNA-binding NarL/FixJ family response regulator